MKKGWRVGKGINNIQCSLVKSPIVFIECIPRRKVELLMEKYSSQEWLGYLVGRMSEKENFFVEDLIIPPHKEAYGASAEAEPFFIPDKCIGVIHSHHSMGAFHSQTDKDYVDQNFPISITVARKDQTLEYDVVCYQITLCGKKTAVKGTVKYVAPPPTFDTETFMKEAVSNIDKGKRPPYIHYPQPPKVIGRLPGHFPRHPSHYPTYQGDYIVGKNGEVLTQKEFESIIKGIWED